MQASIDVARSFGLYVPPGRFRVRVRVRVRVSANPNTNPNPRPDQANLDAARASIADAREALAALSRLVRR